jgi:hypothetical protein
MIPHQYYLDAYYAEQAIACEAASTSHGLGRAAEHSIPMRWIMVWVAAVSSIGLGLGALARWLA